MTDVNLAVELLSDAQNNAFDVAILVSADSDLAKPTEIVRSKFPGKKMVVAFPPGRASKHLRRVSSGYTSISHADIRNSQFPNKITNMGGYVLSRPLSWR